MNETPASPAPAPGATRVLFPSDAVTTPARMQCIATRTAAALREEPSTGNKTYDMYEKKYITWFNEQLPDKKRLFNLKEPHHMVTVTAGEHFFLEVVAIRRLTAQSALKWLYALPKLSAREGSNFTIAQMKTATIHQQLALINARCVKRDKADDDAGRGADGQEKMLSTEIVTQDSLSKVLSKLLESERKWESTAAEISILSITLMRHDSILKVTLGKLYLTYKSPDGDTTPHDMRNYNMCNREPVLGIIVPKLDQVKKQTRDYSQRRIEVHGGFRHKRHERDYIGIVAMSLFVRLNNFTTKNVHFLKNDGAATAASPSHNNAAPIDDIAAAGAAPAAEEEDENEEIAANTRSDAPNSPNIISNDRNNLWRRLKVFPKDYTSSHSAYKAAFEAAKVPKWEKVTHLK